MVHALEEIRRVLTPGGILVDLRPLADSWPVEVTWSGGRRVTGRLTDLPPGLADDAASDKAMQEISQQGLFACENLKHFQVFVYWNDPEEMRLYILDRLNNMTALGNAVLQETISAWSLAGDNRRVRVKMKMLMSVWCKCQDRSNSYYI